MNQNQSRQALKNLAIKYLQTDPQLIDLINTIDDSSRPGLPIRGVLERIKKFRVIEITDSDQEIIEELLYLYG